MTSRLRVLPLLSLLAFTVVGCNSEKPPTAPANATPPANSAAGQAPTGPSTAQGPGLNSTTLHVSEDIARLCNLPTPKQQTNFDFDSANIAPDDKDLLSALAKCLSEGPLKGRNILLTGRADARGEAEYNMGLGGARANSVKQYLKGLGVQDTRIGTTSRGELDAVGKDEAGYAKDRRVDISLAN
jgi:peptidoglycan-associated lipoprotein